MRLWRRGFYNISDDSVSSYGGHRSKYEAIRDAQQILEESDDVDLVWVTDPGGDVVWSMWRSESE